ncbi:MAG: LamG-like jellyroll fold domain-containing protein, partial [Cytophagales bacterium]
DYSASNNSRFFGINHELSGSLSRLQNYTFANDHVITWNKPSNDWVHLAVTYGDGGNVSKIYINGSLQAQSTLNELNTIAQELRIGFSFNQVAQSNIDVDDFRIYNRALSATEISLLYNFNAQTALEDWGAIRFNGLANNNSINDDGLDRITIPAINGPSLNTFTFEARIMVQNANAFSGIFASRGTGAVFGLVLNTVNLNSGTARLAPMWNGANFDWAGPVIEFNKTYHVAMVIQPDSSLIYVNGVRYGLGTTNPVQSMSNDIFLGRDVFESGSSIRRTNSIMDEVRIWNVARSGDQIRANMNCEISSPHSQRNLLVYYRFNQAPNDRTVLKDEKGIRNVNLTEGVQRAAILPYNFYTSLSADFEFNDDDAPVFVANQNVGKNVIFTWLRDNSLVGFSKTERILSNLEPGNYTLQVATNLCSSTSSQAKTYKYTPIIRGLEVNPPSSYFCSPALLDGVINAKNERVEEGPSNSTPTFSSKFINDPPFTPNTVVYVESALNGNAFGAPDVIFQIVSGPASVQGQTFTLTGEPGIVTVMVVSPENEYFWSRESYVCFSVVDPANSLNNSGISNNKIYPNPVKDVLNIEGYAELFNMMGAKVGEGESKIDCSSLPNGVYLVKQGNKMQKVVKE